MNKLQSVGMAAAGGAVVVGALSIGLPEHFGQSPEQAHIAIANCADVLGPVAVQSDMVPTACEPFTESFNPQTVNHDVTDKNGVPIVVGISHTYTLPSANSFTHQQEGILTRIELLEWLGGPVVGAFFGGALVLANPYRKKIALGSQSIDSVR